MRSMIKKRENALQNKLYAWFPDSHQETISIRCFFIMRLMKYCNVEFELNYVRLPEKDLSVLQVEAKEIPILKAEDKLYKTYQIIDLCKETASKENIEILFQDENLAHQIFFQWATTNLLGSYVGLLYGDKEIRERVYKDYQKAYPDFIEKNLDLISESMLEWSIHNEDISQDPKKKKENIQKLIDNLDSHLENNKFWFGDNISINDFALFSFCYMMYNPQFIYFHDYIKSKESLFNWMKTMDHLSRHEHSKIKIGS